MQTCCMNMKKKVFQRKQLCEICEPGTHYLPYYPVLKENQETSKVRIVFDGSSKYKGEPTVNK